MRLRLPVLGSLVLAAGCPAPASDPSSPPVHSAASVPPEPVAETIEVRRGCNGGCEGWVQRTWPWHEARIGDIAITKRGPVTISHDGTLRLWDRQLQPRFVRALDVGESPRLAGHPQRDELLVVVHDQLRAYDSTTGLPTGPLRPIHNDLVELHLHEDGTALLAFASGRIEITRGVEPERELQLPRRLTAAARRGSMLVVGFREDEFGGLALVDLKAGTELGTFDFGEGIMPPVSDIVFREDGAEIVTSGYELSRWDPVARKRIAYNRVTPQPSEIAAADPSYAVDGHAIDFIALGGQLARWSVDDNTIEPVAVDTRAHSATVMTDATVWMGTLDGNVLRIPRSGPPRLFAGPRVGEGVTALAFSRDGQRLLGGLGDGHVVSWDASAGAERTRHKVHAGEVNALWVLDEGTFVSAGDDGAKLIGLENLELQSTLLEGVGVFAISGCDDGSVVLGDGLGNIVWPDGPQRIQAHDKPVLGLDVSPDCQRVVSCSEDGRIRVWQRGRNEPVATFEPTGQRPLQAVAWLDADTVLSAEAFYGKDPLRRWSVRSGAELEPLFETKYGASKIATAAGYVAISDLARGAVLWTAIEQPPLVFPHFNGNAMAVALSPDGKRIALGTTGNEETVRLWDVELIDGYRRSPSSE